MGVDIVKNQQALTSESCSICSVFQEKSFLNIQHLSFTLLYVCILQFCILPPINQILVQIISKTRKSNNTKNVILIKIKCNLLSNDHSITMLGFLNEKRDEKGHTSRERVFLSTVSDKNYYVILEIICWISLGGDGGPIGSLL